MTGGRYFRNGPGHLSHREHVSCCSITEIVRMLSRIFWVPAEGAVPQYVSQISRSGCRIGAWRSGGHFRGGG
jgi:hypothetical protein